MEQRQLPDNGQPDTIRDTVRIRPLSKWASKIFVTAALFSALGLAIYASLMIRSMSADPDIQTRLEVMERMRDGVPAADSTDKGSADDRGATPDSTGNPQPDLLP